MIREIIGIGEGNGPMIGIHTGFALTSKWADFLPGADRVVLGTYIKLLTRKLAVLGKLMSLPA